MGGKQLRFSELTTAKKQTKREKLLAEMEVVVGSGLGGLCAAAMAARHGLELLVLEAHDQPGGAAHGFQRKGFAF